MVSERAVFFYAVHGMHNGATGIGVGRLNLYLGIFPATDVHLLLAPSTASSVPKWNENSIFLV